MGTGDGVVVLVNHKVRAVPRAGIGSVQGGIVVDGQPWGFMRASRDNRESREELGKVSEMIVNGCGPGLYGGSGGPRHGVNGRARVGVSRCRWWRWCRQWLHRRSRRGFFGGSTVQRWGAFRAMVRLVSGVVQSPLQVLLFDEGIGDEMRAGWAFARR